MGRRANSILSLILLSFFGVLFIQTKTFADSPLLSKEENLWLSSRNNTIVVYPEKNDPPFSYQSASGIAQGLSIDYIELIAKNIGAKIHYAVPRSRSQIVDDLKQGKGDVVLSLTPTEEHEESLIFTESYLEIPVVIVVRKDADIKKHVTLNDYTGMRIAVVESSAAEEFIQKNYPRVVIESITDNEIGLQKTVLGETSAAVMDVASLSFLLSKQVLSSVKIAGNVGLNYQLAFAVPKGKEQLQSILEKGLMQIATEERSALAEKWILLPGDTGSQKPLFTRLQENAGLVSLYIVFLFAIIGGLVLIFRRRQPFRMEKRGETVGVLESEMTELEDTSKVLAHELERIKEKEREIAQKIEEIKG